MGAQCLWCSGPRKPCPSLAQGRTAKQGAGPCMVALVLLAAEPAPPGLWQKVTPRGPLWLPCPPVWPQLSLLTAPLSRHGHSGSALHAPSSPWRLLPLLSLPSESFLSIPATSSSALLPDLGVSSHPSPLLCLIRALVVSQNEWHFTLRLNTDSLGDQDGSASSLFLCSTVWGCVLYTGLSNGGGGIADDTRNAQRSVLMLRQLCPKGY